jgi:hypothetical protein
VIWPFDGLGPMSTGSAGLCPARRCSREYELIANWLYP